MKRFLWFGHRGASGTAPENTLLSIRQALALGADGVEVDLQLTADGTAVILHDETLQRTTGTPGRIAQTPLADLLHLDAGCGEPIPTLDQLLDTFPEDRWLNLELKAPGSAQALIAALACRPTRRRDHLLISSFKLSELTLIAETNRHTPSPLQIGLLIDQTAPPDLTLPSGPLATLAAGWVHLPLSLATPDLLTSIRATGRRTLVYTVNDLATIQQLERNGANGVFTDHPELREK